MCRRRRNPSLIRAKYVSHCRHLPQIDSSCPVFSWRTTLSASLFNTSPRLSLHSIYADLSSSLLTYAFALSNLARSVVASLGAYERERGISDADRKAKDERLNFAVTLLCRASGLFSHISDQVLVSWDKKRAADPTPTDVNRPPDLSREVNAALAKWVLSISRPIHIINLTKHRLFLILIEWH
jgi:hypothetical protein